MASWNGSTGYLGIGIGTLPNDGTGDNIRDAFIKVDNNFSNISSYLSSTSFDFLNANIQQNLITNYVTASNLSVTNTTGTTATFAGNVTANVVIANNALISNNVTNLIGNTTVGNIVVGGTLSLSSTTYTSASLIPTANISYDIGSPSLFFRNIYAQGLVQVNTVTASSDAGILLLHANLSPGDVKDVGILGKYNESGSNTYAYFGYQHVTDNFVYKQTPTNATTGNSVVYDGVYGNTQFGSQYLSNSTVSTSTTTGALIVAGGAGIAGNLNAGRIITTTANIGTATITNIAGNTSVDGNIYSNGSQVVTFSLLPQYTYGTTTFVNAVTSTSTTTGALTVPNGGLGVGGNINAGGNISASGFIGPVYGSLSGNISLNYTNQPIFQSGQISQFSAQSISFTNLNGPGVSVTGLTGNVYLNTTGTSLWTAGNINAVGYIGPVYGAQPNITSIGTQSSLAVTGNSTIGNVVTTGGTYGGIYGTVVYDSGNRVVSTSTGTGNLTISGTGINLTPSGPGATTVGSGSAIPVITTDQYGRIANISTVAVTISTSLTTAGTSGTGTVPLSNQSLTFVGSYGVTATASGNAITISTPQDIRSTASPTFVTVTANITGNTTGTHFGNVVGNVSGSAGTAGTATTATYVTGLTAANVQAVIGSVSTASFPTLNQNTTGTAATVTTAAQPNITSVGTLTGLTVSGAIVPNANVSVNLGSSTAWWNSIYGTAIHAQYADLAEMYTSDADYPPGTVLIFGGDAEVTVTDIAGDTRVAGAVSTKPAYLMNSETSGVALALRGRVPVRVVGKVTKGDLLITSTHPGCAQSDGRNSTSGAAVFAKAIESSDDHGEKIIEAVIL